MTDVDDLGDPPPRGRRPRLTRLAPEVQGADREAVAVWIKEQIDAVEQEHRARIELLRHGKEHPNPAFEGIVRRHGIVGTQKSTLAKLLGISVGTLNAHYAEVYEIAAAETMAKIGANVIQKAMNPNDPDSAKLAMAILDRRGGEEWRPPTRRLEVDKKEGQSLPVIDSSKMTYEERQQMRAMLERIANGGDGDPPEEEEA